MYKNLTNLAKERRIVLGSGSPRRMDLLKETGIEFRQQISNFAEHDNDRGRPYEHARELAEAKALAVAYSINSNELVIGADTVVVLDGCVIGKPVDKDDAAGILRRLSGKTHTVCSALAIAQSAQIIASGFELTDVFFNKVTADQIRQYIETGEPMDKAGAYGVQGMGGFLVDRIEGNLDNVIGLPRRLLEQLAGEVCVKIKENK